jgi:Flp pilus assembly protein TadD
MGAGCGAAHRPPDALQQTRVFKAEGAKPVEAEDETLADALKALGTHPGPEATRKVAAEYRRLKVFDGAERRLTAALAEHPHDVPLLDELALTWRDAGFPNLALAPAYQAVYLAPRSASAQNTLGTVLFALGHADEAASRFRLAASLDERAGYAHANLCYLSYVAGDLSAALAQCDRALAINPDLANARETRATILKADEPSRPE